MNNPKPPVSRTPLASPVPPTDPLNPGGQQPDGRRPHRRRALKVLGGLGLLGVAGGAAAVTPAQSNAYYTGPVSDHFDGVRFFNPGGPGPKSLRQILKWQFGARAAAWPAAFPSPHAGATPSAVQPAAATRITFIGHASYLVQTGGLNILFDPVFVDRASPVQFAGPKRVNPPGIAFDALPKIDVVLVSHNHYDHLDTATIGRIWARDRPQIITPLGNDTILAAANPGLAARAVDWDQRVDLAGGVAIDCVPTQHWSARGTRDRMHALWASFVVSSPAHTLYLVGDSGFGDGRTFQHVAKRYPRIDFAALPIGAYAPRWFMRDQHMDPAQAVAAFKLSGARRALGHHWGTFKLTSEPIGEPRDELQAAAALAGIKPDVFIAAVPGLAIDLAT